MSLSANERQLWGLEYDDGVLSIGPSGGAWLCRMLLAVHVSLFIGVSMAAAMDTQDLSVAELFTRSGAAVAIVGVAALAGVWLDVWRRLRQRVRCTPEGVDLRYGFFRSKSLAWSEVSGFRVGFHELSRWEMQRMNGWATEYDWPVVTTWNGWISIEGLTTLATSQGWSMFGRSGAEERVTILRRYARQFDVEDSSPLRARWRWPVLVPNGAFLVLAPVVWLVFVVLVLR